jgi:hypothetical protein
MTDETDKELVFSLVVAGIIFAILAARQTFKFRKGCPRLFNGVERKIMFRPVVQATRKRKKLFEFGEALVATQPLLELRKDVVRLANVSRGGMLVVCAPFGHGKTTTAMGVALARGEGMPSRVLCIATDASQQTSTAWLAAVKKVMGMDPERSAMDMVTDLANPLTDPMIRTHDTKRLLFVNGYEFQEPHPAYDYSMLVLEDFSPSELEGMDADADVKDLRGAIDEDVFGFFGSLAQGSFQGGVVVVVTTKCKKHFDYSTKVSTVDPNV